MSFYWRKMKPFLNLARFALQAKDKKVPEMDLVEDEDEDGLDELVRNVKDNKNAGHKRTSPASFAETVKGNQSKPKPKQPSTDKPAQPEMRNDTSASNDSKPKDAHKSKISYCHYFSNFGKCTFEEKTGRKCKFSHQKAPHCNFDLNCNRKKCMFSHTKTSPNQGSPNKQPFLDPGMGFPPHALRSDQD